MSGRVVQVRRQITNGVLSLLHLWDGPSVMKDEEGITWLNNWKLRAGSGITGVIPNDPYMSLTRITMEVPIITTREHGKPGLEVASNPTRTWKWESLRNIISVWTLVS